MRIVVDTNTAISGLLWQGQPRQIIDLVRARTHSLCVSLALLVLGSFADVRILNAADALRVLG